jgi:sialate O-acetylesterase
MARSLVLAAISFACASGDRDAASAAAPLLANVFSSNMVLQREQQIFLYGTTSPGASVNVSMGASPPVSTAADGATGVWRATLAARAASAVPTTVTVSSSSGASLSISNVLVGDVLLVSGQSNAVFSVEMALNASAELAAANAFPLIRVANVPDYAGSWQPEPRADFFNRLAWAVASNTSLSGVWNAGISAFGWFAARDLFVALGGGVPVGLIDSSIGATALREWSPRAALAKCSQPYVSTGRNIGVFAHSQLYNGMVFALTTAPLQLSGVLWWQAESDAWPTTPDGYYGCQIVATINAWRADFKQPLLPWVSAAITGYSTPQPDGSHLGALRQAQLAALALPRVAVVPTTDLADPGADNAYGNIHSRRKQAAGARAAAALLRIAYDSAPAPAQGAALASWPPPAFLDQDVSTIGTNQSVVVHLTLGGSPVVLNASAACNAPAGASCGLNVAIQTDDGAGRTMWWNASIASIVNSPDNTTCDVTFVSQNPSFTPQQCAVGTSYAFGDWPVAQLMTLDGWPVYSWNQSQTVWGPC